MIVATYQIRNVLRAYRNQLKRRMSVPVDGMVQMESSSSVDISVEARKRQALNQFSAELIAQVSSRGQKS